MGEITYQGASPFHVIPASVVGGDPAACQIQVPISPDDAQQLAADLRAAAVFAEKSNG
jgi:hypothetical protein